MPTRVAWNAHADRYRVILTPLPVNEHGAALDGEDPAVLSALHRRVDALDGPTRDRAVTAAREAGLDAYADGRELLHRAVDVVLPWNRLVNTLALDGRDHLVTGETAFEMQGVEEPGLLAALAASEITREPLAETEGHGEPDTTQEDLRPLAAWLAGLVGAAGAADLTADLIDGLVDVERFGTDSDGPLSALGHLVGSGSG
jgi:hypothetical protein